MQTDPNQAYGAGAAAYNSTMSLFYAVVFLLAIVAMWKIFTKAGEEGWKAIIPIYNTMVLLKIVGRPMWWILLLLIPVVNIVVLIVVYNDLSKSFGHGVGFTLGLIFLNIIFFLILAFGSSVYVGPGGVAAAPMAPMYTPPAPPMAPPVPPAPPAPSA